MIDTKKQEQRQSVPSAGETAESESIPEDFLLVQVQVQTMKRGQLSIRPVLVVLRVIKPISNLIGKNARHIKNNYNASG